MSDALDQILHYEHVAMNTSFELMVAGEDTQIAESAAAMAFSILDRQEQELSRFLDVSEVQMISRLKPGEVYQVNKETMDILMASVQICAVTGGAFDVTVGPIMDALRKVDHRWGALTDEEREDAMACCGMNRLILDPDHFLLSIKPDRLGRDTPLELDFGAIGKGFALDLACGVLRCDWELENFLFHGGTSTVIAYGTMGDGKPGWGINVGGDWRVRAGLHAVRLVDGAISGSGFEEQGMHVVDARRGVAAAMHGGAWSYAPNATWADALSTAFLGLSWKEIKETCKKLEGTGALVARDQPVWMDKIRNPIRICGAFPLKKK